MAKKKKKEAQKEDDFFFNLEEIEGNDAEDELETPEIEEEQADEDFENEDISNTRDLTPVDLSAGQSLNEDQDWLDEEGELTIDVYQDNSNIYIKSPLPGIDVEDVDVSLDNDMVTIRAKRDWGHEIDEEDYFFRENYWGSVSRSIILPVEIKADKVDATMKNGVLTVVLPKAKRNSSVNINIKSED